MWLVVSYNGMYYREFFTRSDGLHLPYGIYFEKKEKVLLVCNFDEGKAFMFNINDRDEFFQTMNPSELEYVWAISHSK